MIVHSLRRQLLYAFLLFALLLLLIPRAGFQDDVNYWWAWANHTYESGLPNAYQQANNNYNPLFHYVLWLFDVLAGTPEKIQHYIKWVKGFILLLDFAGAFWAASLVPDRDRRFGLVLLLLLNIGYLYNTLVWVQVDGLYTFFAFGAVVLAVQRRAELSSVCFVLALAAKTQAIIFLPPLLLLWLPQWWQRPLRMGLALLAGAATATLVLAPFIWWAWENGLPRIIEIDLQASSLFPYLSLSAYNLWVLVFPDNTPLHLTSDLGHFGGLTYHNWGLLLFCATSALALLPLLAAVWQVLRRRPGAPATPDMALALLSCGSIPLLFTFFNTQMHERYWHAAVLFLAAYAFLRRDYLPYVLVSVAYFLNLEGVNRYLELDDYQVLLFKPRLIAVLFALAVGLVLFKIYRLAPWRVVRPVVAAPTSLPLAAG